MREILFQGKRLDNGEWVYGFYWLDVWSEGKTAHIIDAEDYLVDPSTVGQYTGLTDRNGVKIFDGCILASHYDDVFLNDVTIEIVLWAKNGWCIKAPGGDLCPLDEDGVLPYSEVIGNVHDNPELLEVQYEN